MRALARRRAVHVENRSPRAGFAKEFFQRTVESQIERLAVAEFFVEGEVDVGDDVLGLRRWASW